MSKFNTNVKPKVRSEGVKATNVAIQTHEGGLGFKRTPKSELFLATVSSFVESTYYESKDARSVRIRSLIEKVANEDDGQAWLLGLVGWLRNKANLRSVSLQVALDSAKVLIDKGIPGSRQIVAAALSRADEPGEALGYWVSNYGKRIPAAVKRGIADGVNKLYNVKSIMKYDSKSNSYRMGDVIQLVHPNPKSADQDRAFKFALDRLYGSDEAMEVDKRTFDADVLKSHLEAGTLGRFAKNSGMTWENVASAIGTSAAMWEQLAKGMGYMALLRNLRNFIESGVNRLVLDQVAARIADAEQVKNSRQLPFRFLSAYEEVKSSNFFGRELEDALEYSTANVPALKGKTLILVDVSGSMTWTNSEHSKRNLMDTACLFGAILAKRSDRADLYTFDSTVHKASFRKSDGIFSIFNNMEKTSRGTDLARAIQQTYNNSYDRVVIITDEQHNAYGRDPLRNVNCPVYLWNLGGYRAAATSRENVFVQGGLSDASFNFIDMIEGACREDWPWLAR